MKITSLFMKRLKIKKINTKSKKGEHKLFAFFVFNGHDMIK